MIDSGADLNTVGKNNVTPLYRVCQNGHIDIAQALFEAGANVDCLKKEGRLYGYKDVIKEKLIYNKSEKIKNLIKEFIDPKNIKKRDKRLENINIPHNDATSPSGEALVHQARVAGWCVQS